MFVDPLPSRAEQGPTALGTDPDLSPNPSAGTDHSGVGRCPGWDADVPGSGERCVRRRTEGKLFWTWSDAAWRRIPPRRSRRWSTKRTPGVPESRPASL
jgi:hypothetical protein